MAGCGRVEGDLYVSTDRPVYICAVEPHSSMDLQREQYVIHIQDLRVKTSCARVFRNTCHGVDFQVPERQLQRGFAIRSCFAIFSLET